MIPTFSCPILLAHTGTKFLRTECAQYSYALSYSLHFVFHLILELCYNSFQSGFWCSGEKKKKKKQIHFFQAKHSLLDTCWEKSSSLIEFKIITRHRWFRRTKQESDIFSQNEILLRKEFCSAWCHLLC
ncbi:hypothetical protein TorRG33x02_209000 [Trema orientale]|uniref:Uncharacterized protein n=1 Tax=Trema orientale TaxID=63057 RepID=A0A2P5ECT7_TREOI|nr:hypothetical protein TorRG33x02_209000 [Trema orientale]